MKWPGSPGPRFGALVAAAGLLIAGADSAAQDWGGHAALLTDYIFRGVQRNDRPGVAQAGIHLRGQPGWYAGVWASVGDPAPPGLGRTELNLSAGIGWDLSERSRASVGVVHYRYPGSFRPGLYDWTEGSVALRWSDRLSLTVAVSPDAAIYSVRGWAVNQTAVSYEASWREPIVGPLSAHVAAGYYDTRSTPPSSYRAWSAGLAARFDALELSLAGFGIDGAGKRLFGPFAADGRWVLAGQLRF